MKIMEGMKKVPGGMMVVPLVLGAIVNTFFPSVLEIGGFTTELFKNGAFPLIALFLVCAGASIDVRQVGVPLYKGIVLTIVKFGVGAIIGIVVGKCFGNEGIFGLTPLAIVGAMTDLNGGLYAALAGEYGDATDVGALSILLLSVGPFFTMVALGIGGLAKIPYMAIIATIVPILVGFILGNLDSDWKEFLAKGQDMLIPFFAFPLGASLDFKTIISAGLPGVILGLMTVTLVGMAGYFAYGLFGERKAIGAAIGNTAGASCATPAAVAAVDKSLQPYVASATAQIGAAVIITAILNPLLVAYIDKLNKKDNE